MNTVLAKRTLRAGWAGLCMAALLAGCASPVPTGDIEIDTVSDPKANLSGYTRYAWIGSAVILNDPEGQWEPAGFDADAEIKFLIDRELRKRGMTESTTDPDLAVLFAAGVDMDALELQLDADTGMESLIEANKGGLLIALLDTETGFAVWAGIAVADIQEQPDAETSKARLDYAVKALFKQMPK